MTSTVNAAAVAPIQRLSSVFALNRSGGLTNQSFRFSTFDAGNADATAVQAAALIYINPDNTVSISDNSQFTIPVIGTGVSLQNQVIYQLNYEVNFATATWSAEIIDFGSGATVGVLADGRAINSATITLSGWTGVGGFADLATYDFGQEFADQLLFQTYTITSIPEPASVSLLIAGLVLSFVGLRRRRTRA